MSRRSSVDLGDHSRESEFVVLKERKLVAIEPVRMGMARLSFLLETCQPGSVPDSHLLAAILDLVSGSTPLTRDFQCQLDGVSSNMASRDVVISIEMDSTAVTPLKRNVLVTW